MGRPKNTSFNLGIVITPPGTHYPQSSWWVGLSRVELDEAVARERERMSKSRYGTMNTPTYGPVDHKSAFLRARYAKAPGMLRDMD